MELQVITNIVISVVGAVIGLLLLVIGFFIIRLISQVDNTSKSVDKLTTVVDKLNITIESIQRESASHYHEFQNRLDEHHGEIEMLRATRHKMLGYITSMKLQGQLKNGWDFKGPEWDLPAVPTFQGGT